MKKDLRGKLTGLLFDPKARRQVITMELCEDFREDYDQFTEKDLTVTLKPYFKKRSLDANALFWATVGDIAEVTKEPKTEIYRALVREIGGNYEVIPIKTERLETVRRWWESRGDGWLFEVIGPCRSTPGYSNVKAYCGSSEYDTAQMSRLIDLAIQEAKAQNIPLRATPAQIQIAKEEWGREV